MQYARCLLFTVSIPASPDDTSGRDQQQTDRKYRGGKSTDIIRLPSNILFLGVSVFFATELLLPLPVSSLQWYPWRLGSRECGDAGVECRGTFRNVVEYSTKFWPLKLLEPYVKAGQPGRGCFFLEGQEALGVFDATNNYLVPAREIVSCLPTFAPTAFATTWAVPGCGCQRMSRSFCSLGAFDRPMPKAKQRQHTDYLITMPILPTHFTQLLPGEPV